MDNQKTLLERLVEILKRSEERHRIATVNVVRRRRPASTTGLASAFEAKAVKKRPVVPAI